MVNTETEANLRRYVPSEAKERMANLKIAAVLVILAIASWGPVKQQKTAVVRAVAAAAMNSVVQAQRADVHSAAPCPSSRKSKSIRVTSDVTDSARRSPRSAFATSAFSETSVRIGSTETCVDEFSVTCDVTENTSSPTPAAPGFISISG